MISATIKGGRELDAYLQMLPVEVETKILTNALAKGGNIIRDEAKARIRKRSGRTARAIKTTRTVDKTQGQVVVKIKLDRKRAFIGRFLEYGTAAHQIWVAGGKGSLVINGVAVGKQVFHPGASPMPFLRPSLDARAADAVQEVVTYLTSYLQFGSITAPVVNVDLEEAA